MEIVCINNKDKPSEYPSNETWLKEGLFYTPLKVAYLIDGNIGVKVAEITPSEDNPFQYFNINRFAVPEEFFAWADEMLQNQKGDSPDVDFEELIKEEHGTLI